MENRFSFIAIIISISFFQSGCEDNACLKSAGNPVFYEEKVAAFNAIEVNDHIRVVLVQSADTIIKISTSENLYEFIRLNVEDQVLKINDTNSCNWLREYGKTTIEIHHPYLRNINHFGSNQVLSHDTLFYEELRLYSKDNSGDYNLLVSSDEITISINSLNNIKISGRTNILNVGVYAGDGRVEAEGLESNSVIFFHRGTNDLQVYPVELLQGEIASTGDLLYYNKPAVIKVEDNYPGSILPQF